MIFMKIEDIDVETKNKIYQAEKKKRQKKFIKKLDDNTTVFLGDLLLPIFIILSSSLISILSVVYIIATDTSLLIQEFVNDPFGTGGAIAMLGLFAFLSWMIFGVFSVVLYIQGKKLKKENPKKYKYYLKIFK